MGVIKNSLIKIRKWKQINKYSKKNKIRLKTENFIKDGNNLMQKCIFHTMTKKLKT